VGIGQAISFLLNNLTIAARARVQGKFSWERYVDGYDLLYWELGKTSAYVSV